VATAANPAFEVIEIGELDKQSVSPSDMKNVLQELVANDAKIVYLSIQQAAQRELFKQVYKNRDAVELDMYTSLGQPDGSVFLSTYLSKALVTSPDTGQIDHEAAMGAVGLVGLIEGSETNTSMFKNFQQHWGKVASSNACSSIASNYTPVGGPYCDQDSKFDTFGGYTLLAADQIVAFAFALDALLQYASHVPLAKSLFSTLLETFDSDSTLTGVSGPIKLDRNGDRIGTLEIQNFQIDTCSDSGAFYKVGMFSDKAIRLVGEKDNGDAMWVARADLGSSAILPLAHPLNFQEIQRTSTPDDGFRKLYFPGKISFATPPADRPPPDSANASPISSRALAAAVAMMVLLVSVGLALGFNWKLQRKWKRRSIDFYSKMKSMQSEGGLAESDGSLRSVPREIKRSAVQKTNKVGAGQFGEVWKGLLDESATREVDAFMVAVKSTHGVEGEAAEELQREAIVMALVGRHPNLVSLIGVVTTGPPLLLVISMCEHGSLSSQLMLRPQQTGVLVGSDGMEPKCNFEIAREVARGMAMLASKGFVHRDLAARNVLIDSALICKVADFGLSRETKLDDAGTAVYASSRGMFPLRWTPPEAMHDMLFSTATDVWSFGVLVLEVYEDGAQPYIDVSNEQLLGMLTSGWRAPKPTTCPSVVYGNLLECWDADPCSRPTFDSLDQFYGQVGNIVALRTLSSLQPVIDLGPFAVGATANVQGNTIVQTCSASLEEVDAQELHGRLSFEETDADGDGEITKEEAQALGIDNETFEKIDADQNGFVAEDECDQWQHELQQAGRLDTHISFRVMHV
jgi:serine/threonine protein kinase